MAGDMETEETKQDTIVETRDMEDYEEKA